MLFNGGFISLLAIMQAVLKADMKTQVGETNDSSYPIVLETSQFYYENQRYVSELTASMTSQQIHIGLILSCGKE